MLVSSPKKIYFPRIVIRRMSTISIKNGLRIESTPSSRRFTMARGTEIASSVLTAFLMTLRKMRGYIRLCCWKQAAERGFCKPRHLGNHLSCRSSWRFSITTVQGRNTLGDDHSETRASIAGLLLRANSTSLNRILKILESARGEINYD
jgi:hypothetical protein